MKKIWKTWKPRKKESRGNQELCFHLTPRKMKVQSACICAHGSCAVYCASPDRTAAPNTYL